MKKLGVNVISESKNGRQREVVHIKHMGGSTRKGEPKLFSATRHQIRVGNQWLETDKYFTR